jgi:uncharacterized membrane protein YphA (DoxX/SURF4 family)
MGLEAGKLVGKWVLPPLDVIARVYLGGVFIYAAWGKIIDPYGFAVAIATYQMMPTYVLNIMAITMPWLELFTGVLLILGIWTRANVILINGMMVMFIIAISVAVYRGLDLGTCGCFASEEAAEEISVATIWRDVGWLAIGVFIFFVQRHRWGLDDFWHHLRRKHA